LVIEELRTDVTKTRKDGTRGRLRYDYGEHRDPQAAIAWLWKYIVCRVVRYAEFIMARSAARPEFGLLRGITGRRGLFESARGLLCAADDGAHAHGLADVSGGCHRADRGVDFARELWPVGGRDLVG